MRYTYWHKHPRGLANECVMLRVCTPAQMRALSQMGYERLTACQARRHKAWVNAEIDASHGLRRGSGPQLARVPRLTDYLAEYVPAIEAIETRRVNVSEMLETC